MRCWLWLCVAPQLGCALNPPLPVTCPQSVCWGVRRAECVACAACA